LAFFHGDLCFLGELQNSGTLQLLHDMRTRNVKEIQLLFVSMKKYRLTFSHERAFFAQGLFTFNRNRQRTVNQHVMQHEIAKLSKEMDIVFLAARFFLQTAYL
jgi:hypothetical protein